MKRFVKTLAWTLLAFGLTGAVLVAGGLALAWPLDHTVIRINGDPVNFSDNLAGLDLGALAGGAVGVAVAVLVVMIVVPVAVVLPLLIVAVVLAAVMVAVLAAVFGVAALAFSPVLALLAIVWLAWRAARHREKRQAAAASPAAQPGATMP